MNMIRRNIGIKKNKDLARSEKVREMGNGTPRRLRRRIDSVGTVRCALLSTRELANNFLNR